MLFVVEEQLDLIVLDWMLFNVSGIEICCCVKVDLQIWQILIIMLFVCLEEVDWVCGLEIGVDDYVVKFYLVVELMVWLCMQLCCICLVLMGEWFSYVDIIFDVGEYCVFCGGQVLYLGLIEFCLLFMLMEKFGWVWMCE